MDKEVAFINDSTIDTLCNKGKIPRKVAREIVRERKSGPFVTFESIGTRVGCVDEALAKTLKENEEVVLNSGTGRDSGVDFKLTVNDLKGVRHFSYIISVHVRIMSKSFTCDLWISTVCY